MGFAVRPVRPPAGDQLRKTAVFFCFLLEIPVVEFADAETAAPRGAGQGPAPGNRENNWQ